MAYSDYSISAALGNMWSEGGMDPTRWEADWGSGKPDSGMGYGLVQWTGSPGRRDNLFNYLDNNGYPRSDFSGNFTGSPIQAGLGQIMFFLNEGFNNGRNWWGSNSILGTTSVYTTLNQFLNSSSTDLNHLSDEFLYYYESPFYEGQSEEARQSLITGRRTQTQNVYNYIIEHKNDTSITWSDFVVKPNAIRERPAGGGLTVAERYVNAVILYRLLQGQRPGDEPGIHTVTITTDGHGSASCSPTSGTQGTRVTISYTPNSGYIFDEYEILAGGVVISNNSFLIGSANVSIKVKFKESSMGYEIPKVPYFCQWEGFIDYDTRVVSDNSLTSVMLGTAADDDVHHCGCGPSCASMAISYIRNQKTTINDFITKLGGYSQFMVGGVGNWNLGITLANAYGIQAKRTHDHNEAYAALKEGNLVMAITGNANVGTLPGGRNQWSSGGHYILLIGVASNGQVAVNDPGTLERTYWNQGINTRPIGGTWDQSWEGKKTIPWSQITPAVRTPGNKNTDGRGVAGNGAYTIFYVPESRKSAGSYTPPQESPTAGLPIKQEKGIQGLKIDFDIWKAGTHLIKIGDYVKLKAVLKQGSTQTYEWYDITDPARPVKYTPTELHNHFGISYTKVNNGYVGKFKVSQSPLSAELGGTGTSSIEELLYALYGTDSSAGGYDFSTVTNPNISTDVDKITLPKISKGHVITAEARSASRDGKGYASVGDQAQDRTSDFDTVGEVSFIYDRDVRDFTAVYRLASPGNPIANAVCKATSLKAANHACFLAQQAKLGYNYYTQGQQALWTYIKANKGNITFGNLDFSSDTNCINFCKMVYAAVMYGEGTKKYFDTNWTTAGILSSNTLEKLGFVKYGSSFAQNPNNLEIGDILVRGKTPTKEGHAAIVVAAGDKSWVLNGVDYNPKNGEVKT